jgi:DNA replication protein DnaC
MMYDINQLSSLKKHWLLRNSNIPRRFLGLEPSDIEKRSGEFPVEVSTWINDTVEGRVIKQIGNIGVNGVGLLFDGGPGIGKTTHAVVAAMEFVRNLPDNDAEAAKILGMSASDFGLGARPVYYMTYPEFLSRKKATFDSDMDDKKQSVYEIDGFHGRAKFDWLNVRILVIDDLGKEYGSKYDDTSFDEILRLRYDKALPTIVTTNVRLENWEAEYKEAMASFAHEAFIRVPIVGSDMRAAQ